MSAAPAAALQIMERERIEPTFVRTAPIAMTETYSEEKPLRLKDMRPPEIAAALRRDARLIVPVGTCEQHGLHLPLGAGTVIVERLADDLSAHFGVLRAPTVEYGVNMLGDAESPGNASLCRKSLHRMLNDLLASWEHNRVRKFILLTAHGYDPHLDALSMVMTERSEVRVVDILSTGISDLLEGQSAPLRGDEADTSLLLYIAPSLVDEHIQDYTMSNDEVRRYRRGSIKLVKGAGGVDCRPTLATAEKGRVIYQRIYDRVASRVFARDVAQEIAEE
jgi:creatinine amidohydrolase